jgi:hypothetical protein
MDFSYSNHKVSSIAYCNPCNYQEMLVTKYITAYKACLT